MADEPAARPEQLAACDYNRSCACCYARENGRAAVLNNLPSTSKRKREGQGDGNGDGCGADISRGVAIATVPYGVLGPDHGNGPEAVGAIIVDPAGQSFLPNGVCGAGGLSGALYARLHLMCAGCRMRREGGVHNAPSCTRPEPFDASTMTMQRTGDASFARYLGPHGYANVIHVFGPNFTLGSWTEDLAITELARAYENVLRTFVQNNAGTQLWLLPISSGVFAGHFTSDMPRFTATALGRAVGRVKELESAARERPIALCCHGGCDAPYRAALDIAGFRSRVSDRAERDGGDEAGASVGAARALAQLRST